MRIRSTFAFVAIAAAALAAGLLTPAAGQAPLNTFTVVKVVEGPVPAGAVFEVQVDCVSQQTSPGTEGGSTTFQFDENGDPIGPNSVEVGLFETCTATETVTNGAAVTYACAIELSISSPDDDEGNGLVLAECVDDQTVAYHEVVGAEGTITVTNTFEEEEPPPPDVEPDDVEPDVVTATPSFTG